MRVRGLGYDPRRAVSVGFVGTYKPTKCGIATFTESLGQAIAEKGAEKTADEHRRRVEQCSGEGGHEGSVVCGAGDEHRRVVGFLDRAGDGDGSLPR